MSDARSLTLDDWGELLSLDGVLDDLAEGRIGPAEVRHRLAARREVYPGVGLDYVRALDAFAQIVGRIEVAIAQQNEALDTFNSSSRGIGETFSFDRTRLLTAAERAAFDVLRAGIERDAPREDV